MEKDKLVIMKPKQYPEEAYKLGTEYYDYDNNVNLQWRYFPSKCLVRVQTICAKGKSAGASTRKCSNRSTL